MLRFFRFGLDALQSPTVALTVCPWSQTTSLFTARARLGGPVIPRTEVLAEGIFFVNVPDPLGYHAYVPALTAPSVASSAAQTDRSSSLDTHVKAPVASRNTADHSHTTSSHTCVPEAVTIGMRVPSFVVSSVFERGGVLWQWRAVACAPASARTAGHSSRQPVPARAQNTNIRQHYVLLPFVLHTNGCLPGSGCGGGGVESSNAIVVGDAAHCCVARVFGVRRSSLDIVVPCVLGDIQAGVLRSHASHSTPHHHNNSNHLGGDEDTGIKRDPKEARKYATRTPAKEENWFARDYLALLQRLCPSAAGFEKNATHGSVHRIRNSVPAYEYVCRVRLSPSTAEEDPIDACFSRGKTKASSNQGVAAFVSSVDEVKCDHDETLAERAQTTEAGVEPHVSFVATDAAKSRITEAHRNVILGGLAEVILCIDAYAALVARKELTVAAACWAVLCDTRHVDLRVHLRMCALDIEREVIAAVAAHEVLHARSAVQGRALTGET